MNILKKIFYIFFATILIVSCEPVRNTYTSDVVMLDVYKVNYNKTLTPEFGDTILRVVNVDEFDLKSGERACLLLNYHFDAYNSKNTELKIAQLVEKIPTLTITARDVDNMADYDLPLRVYAYCCQPAIWVWDNHVNVNALFKAKPDATDFVMSLRSVAKDTVNLNLFAKTTAPSDSLFTKLLSYDLENIGDLLTDDEKDELKSYEKLTLKIFMKNKNSENCLVEQAWSVMKGEFDNPLY